MGITNGGGDGSGDDCIISSRCFPGGWGAAATAAKPCDYCKIAAALVFCRVEAVFMCLGCDTKVHASNRIGSKHERVWVCEVCEHAPAAVTCKADAAALCITCDRDIHSANPLARRHERVPVAPFYDSAESVVKSIPAATLLIPVNDSNSSFAHDNLCSDSWVSSTPITSKLMQENTPGMKSSSLEFSLFDSDNFLDFEYPVSWDSNSQNPYNSDRVVPIQTVKTSAPNPTINQENHFEIDFTRSNITSYNSGFIKPSLSVSSSMDVGVVPDGSTASEISYRSVDSRRGGGSEWNNGILMDREARVLRYREKRKNRKFEKTIRYASRKAYAETRPRIKGRFAKRTEVESESDIDTLFSSSDSVADVGRYGVVPSLW